MIVLGERIREYRLRGGKTQEALACELGVTAQAVSRWEKGACYPDMELLPSIANSFGVSIDELFGYDNERSRRVDELYRKITEMNRANNGVDVSMNECLCLAREALIEFPGNEKLTFALASALFNAGYVRRGEHHIEDREGFIVYDAARHRLYPEWQEAIKLYEKLLVSLPDGEMKQEAVLGLSQLYKNTGEREKAQRLAENAPALRSSRPFLLINASDGKEAAAASGKALIETVRASAELIEEIVRADRGIAPETAAAMLENAVSMLGLVFTDGRFGRLSGFAACLQMLRSYYLWLADDKDGAFSALGSALAFARAADSLRVEEFSAPLLMRLKPAACPSGSPLAPELPELWPWWDVPEGERVVSEMRSDPRWAEWKKACGNGADQTA